jgi:hypothetical protein
MNTLYIYLLIFACIAYLIITDESIARAVTLLSQIIKFQFEKMKWMILNDPRNPIVRYLINRRSNKIAKDLMKELKKH